MYCALLKKVNVTKSEHLTKIATNKNTNFIGLGGTNGFVQIVDLDFTKVKSEGPVHSQLRFSQTLQYHTNEITILAWNDIFNKLTTCDKSGIIIVWRCQDGKWESEMINNREVSYVTDLKWSKQGYFLCFIYEDGHAIVGTVEGNRSWGNDVRSSLYLIEWSPDGSNLLLAAKDCNVLILSSSGQQLGELELPMGLKKVIIASMAWWTNIFSENRSLTLEKHLLLAFENGIVCLYDNETDANPWEIKTNFSNVIKAEWNLTGDVFAICGTLSGEVGRAAVCFYSCKGDLIRVLKAPEPVLCISWDANGTKIALETKGALYFALTKPKYKWCYFLETLVYSYLSEQDHHTLIFWDIKTNNKNYKYVKNLIDITSSHSLCLISARISENNILAILSNSIGSPVDNKIINIEPILMALNNTHAILTDLHYVYLWQFRGTDKQKTDSQGFVYQGEEISTNLLTKKMMREICFFIDEAPNMNDIYNYELFNPSKKSNDPISSIHLSENFLFVACNSGKILKYDLLTLSSCEKFLVGAKYNQIGSSPNSRYFWGIDDNNILNIWDIEKIDKKGKCPKILIESKDKDNKEAKDVWSVLWSDDNSLSFAYLEKNKLAIINNLKEEECLICNGYLADFSKLNITVVKMEELMFKPWDNTFEVKDIIIKMETRILRDLREQMKVNVPIEEIYRYTDEHSNRKTWELLSSYSLSKLDFATAEKAMIHMNNYMGLNFINRVKTIDDDNLKKAEVAQFFQDYDHAEDIFNQSDRRDLAISMRIKLGHWDKVINMVKDSGVVKEDNLKVSYSNYADQFVDKREYELAEELYKKAGNTESLLNLWFITEEFDKAANYIEKMPEQSEYLLYMGNKFQTYGLCEEAIKCYLRYGDAKKAIDTCVLMNKWNLAVDLAEKNNFFQIEGLVNKFGSILIEKNKKMDLVELYRKAHRHTDAAKILLKIAEDLKVLNASPLILKKIYIVAALEMESFKSRLIDAQITNITQQTAVRNTTTLDTLVTSDLSNVSDKTLNNPWKGAEAIHFYMLCQSQLYQNKTKEALKTALRLVLYEKELNPKEVYRLIALSSFLNHSYKECSKALSKLEHLGNVTEAERKRYQALAITIFINHKPKNSDVKHLKCPSKNCGGEITEFDIDCKTCGSNYTPCVASGQSIFQKDYFKCERCKHKCLKSEVIKRAIKHCPLCHVFLDLVKQ